MVGPDFNLYLYVLAANYWIVPVAMTETDTANMMREGDRIQNDANASYLIYGFLPCVYRNVVYAVR